MTEAQYIKQNQLGFEGDVIAKEKFQQIIESKGIKTVIETGSYLGSTTKLLAQWVDKVYTVEVNPQNYAKARRNLTGFNNVEIWQGNSAELLPRIIQKTSGNLFFFLDAHWNAHNPLLEELDVIAKHGLKPHIAIHDFKVPGHPELGFDSYAGQDYEWEWIKSAVEKIYGTEGYEVEYNSEATGAKRGIIYLSPKSES